MALVAHSAGDATHRRAGGARHHLSSATTSQAKPRFASPSSPFSRPREAGRRSRAAARCSSPPPVAPAVLPPFFKPEPFPSYRTSPRTSKATSRARFRPLLAGIKAAAVGRRNPKPRAPPLLVDVPFLPLLDSIQGSGGLPLTLIHVPDLFFLGFMRHLRRERFSLPCAAALPSPARRPSSGPSSCTTSVRTEAAQPCWTYSRPPLLPS